MKAKVCRNLLIFKEITMKNKKIIRTIFVSQIFLTSVVIALVGRVLRYSHYAAFCHKFNTLLQKFQHWRRQDTIASGECRVQEFESRFSEICLIIGKSVCYPINEAGSSKTKDMKANT
jgi:hypothetical protein